jgi:hypothetical protein
MRHSELQSPLVVCWGLATLSTAGVLIWTVLFPHDLQIVALPGVLAICMAVAWIETARQRREVTLVAVALTIAVGVIAFGGVRISGLANGGSAESAQPLSEWTRTPVSVTARLLDRGAMITGKRGTLTYARLGTNNDDAHGAFDAGDIRLACPVFAQYPFSVNLDQTLTCLVRTHPDLVVEGPGFAPSTPQRTGSTGSGYAADWTAFVDQSLAVLRKNYVRLGTAQDVGGVVSVWCARQVCPVPTPTGSEPR